MAKCDTLPSRFCHNDVVEQLKTRDDCGLTNADGRVEIFRTRRWVAARMIVRQGESTAIATQHSDDNLPYGKQRLIHTSLGNKIDAEHA
jgi:hypothetical protein